MPGRDPSFAIPARPERTYPRGGGVEYEGEVVFELDPGRTLGPGDPDPDSDSGGTVDPGGSDPGRADDELDALVRAVLARDCYRWGDFLELPMPLYLVRDEGTGDVFRVSVRDGSIRLHVLPATESAGLRRFYERLGDRSAWDWRVRRHADLGDG